MRCLFFVGVSFKEKCYCIRQGAHIVRGGKDLLMGAQLNTQGFLPVAFAPVTFYNKSKDSSFRLF